MKRVFADLKEDAPGRGGSHEMIVRPTRLYKIDDNCALQSHHTLECFCGGIYLSGAICSSFNLEIIILIYPGQKMGGSNQSSWKYSNQAFNGIHSNPFRDQWSLHTIGLVCCTSHCHQEFWEYPPHHQAPMCHRGSHALTHVTPAFKTLSSGGRSS